MLRGALGTIARGSLPYWVEQRDGYGGSVFLHGVYLGFTRGQWPVQAFAADADGGCASGARWAAERRDGELYRVLVGPIPIPDDVPVVQGKTHPTTHSLEPVTP